MTGVTKAYPGVILHILLDDAYKRTLAAKSERVAHVSASGILSRYQSGLLPYV